MTLRIEAGAKPADDAAPFGERLAALVGSPFNLAVSVAVALAGASVGWQLLRWAVIDATWSGGAEACRIHAGACWPFVRVNARLMFFGTYPEWALWRAEASLALMVAVIAASMAPRAWGWPLAVAWAATPVTACVLLSGVFTSTPVATNDWGGLPLTLLVWMIAFAGSFLAAVPLALARRSPLGGLRTAAVVAIELIRAVPMLVALYVSRFIVPMAAPGLEINLFVSVEAALVLFVASYLAEILRAGFQALPRGQYEAAQALGLSYFCAVHLVLLPQALRAVIPALVNLGIGLLLSTPLITVIGMTDFLSAVRVAAAQEQEWPRCYAVAYLFAGGVFFAICFSASRYSRWLEKRLRAAGHS